MLAFLANQAWKLGEGNHEGAGEGKWMKMEPSTYTHKSMSISHTILK